LAALKLEQIRVEPRTSALNMTLPAAAARAPADIDQLALAVPVADTDRKATAVGGTDRQTDGHPTVTHRQCSDFKKT